MTTSTINSQTSSNQTAFQNTAPITALPKDMIMEICRFLDICSVAAVMTSCKQLNQACHGQLLWQRLWLRDFSAENLQMQTNDWRDAYKTSLKIEYLDIPFPGKTAVFKMDPAETWEPHYSGAYRIRSLRFVSEQPDTLIQKFTLHGYKGGNFALSIELFTEQKERLGDYLHSIDPSDSLLISSFEQGPGKNFLYVRDPDLIKKLFRILKFNQIPDEGLTLMRRIIWAKNWQKATPLSAAEVQSMALEKQALKSRQASFLTQVVHRILGKIIGVENWFRGH